MTRRSRGALAGLAAAGFFTAAIACPSPASAQEDFRQSEPDRPVRVEDAHPMKFREWEVEAGLRTTLAEGGSAGTAKGELKTGLLRNAQVGLEVEATVDGEGPGSRSGIETIGLHLLYGVVRETWRWPAIAARVDVRAPGFGSAGRERTGAVWKGMLTRSFGRVRLHGNAGYGVAGQADGADYWLGGIGFDFPIGLFSRAVLGDVLVEAPVREGRARVWLEVGTRWQVTNRRVLDLGVATRLDEWERGRANVELVVGMSRIFGVRGLTHTPEYPDPPLR